MDRFLDRRHAGRVLARTLLDWGRASGRDWSDAVVLALPRGGVPVALEVAAALDAPLDVFTVRKLGVPGHEELALGAVASGGVRVLSEELIESLGIPDGTIEAITRRELAELVRREALYRGGAPAADVRGRTVLLVDDGLATGSSMRAAIAAVRRHGPAEVIVAVPVAPRSTCDELRSIADGVVCVAAPDAFLAVGIWYADFSQTTDEEVREILARRRAAVRPAAGSPP